MKRLAFGVTLALVLGANAFGQDLIKPTEQQVQVATSKFAAPKSDKELRALIDSARNRALDVVLTQACYTDHQIHRVLGRYVVPGRTTHNVFLVPMTAMSHHDRSTCLNVDRVDAFKKLANNAIGFRVVFVSPSSGESAVVNYSMTRQTDGEWLINQAGF